MKHLLVLTLCLGVGVGLGSLDIARADYQIAIPVFATQPDGTRLELRATGDEFHQVTETVDGYTVTLNRTTGWVCYAALSPDGERLIPTRGRVGRADPAALGLRKHLRIAEDAFRREVEAAMALQRGAADKSEPGLPFRPSEPLLGVRVGVTILIDFDDEPGTIPPIEIDDYLNLNGYVGYGNNGSVRNYFMDTSLGLLDYTNLVPPAYYRADSLKSWYDDASAPRRERAHILVLEALDALEAWGFDFSACDGDGDGKIDAINIFYAGYRGAEWAQGLWPHAHSVSFAADGVVAAGYQMTDIRASLSLGTFCHENGHLLGRLPDLYDYGYESKGVGYYCLMGYGGAYRTNPMDFCAPMKRYLGWSNDTELADPAVGLTLTAGSNDVFYFPNRFDDPVTNYYLIENRQRNGRDLNLPDAGLAIWHVDETGSNNNEQMTWDQHYEVTLVQADGLWDLENGVNYGDGADLWGAPDATEFSPFTTPAATWWHYIGSDLSGLVVENIGVPGPVMTFDFDLIDWTGDCNANGVADVDEIGPESDVNASGTLDECEVLIHQLQTYDPETGWSNTLYRNQTLTVFGEVYAGLGAVRADFLHIRDGTGGIGVYAPGAASTAVGDTVLVTAKVLSDFNEETHLGADAGAQILLVGHGPEPDPLSVTVADLTGSYDHVGDFVEFEGDVIYVDSDAVIVHADGAVIQVPVGAGIDTGDLVAGPAIRIRGVCMLQDRIVQVRPRVQADLAAPLTAEPLIVSVADVAGDQGLQVWLAWLRSANDRDTSPTPVSAYVVYRESLATGPAPAGWDSLLTVAAVGAGSYEAVVPTHADSSGSGLPYDATFFVRALTDDGAVYFDSAPASGYSVDNIVPGPATGFSAAYAAVGNTLDWDDAPDPDFRVYRIYRGSAPDFEVSAVTLQQEVTASAWTDTDPDPWTHHYRIAVVDDAGNESIAVAPDEVSGVEQTPTGRTVLFPAVPNPFNPRTRVAYETARMGRVRLRVFDPAGRLVAVLVDNDRPAGRHVETWDGTDQAGRRVAAGVYLYRLEAGGVTETRRLVLVK